MTETKIGEPDYFELSPTPGAVLQLDWTILRANNALREASGLNAGDRFVDLLPPMARREFLDQVSLALSARNDVAIPARVELLGRERLWRVSLRIVGMSMLAACQDETEYLTLRERDIGRRENEDILQRLARIGSWRVRKGGEIVEISEGFRQIIARWDHLIAPDCDDGYYSVPIDEVPELRTVIFRTLQGSSDGHLEERFTMEAEFGVTRHIRVVAHKLLGLSRGTGPVEGVAIDETDITLARDAAEANREKLDFVLKLAGATIWEYNVLDRNLVLSGAGPLAHAFEADQSRKSVDWFWKQILSEELESMRAAWTAHLTQGEPFVQEHRIRDRHGDIRWVLSIVHAHRDRDGAMSRVAGFTMDITARKNIELNLAEARREALAAAEAKGRFLANMSHEIRTPLNGVIGVIGALARTSLSDAQLDMVKLVMSSGVTLDRLLTDILDFSKIEEGRLQLAETRFDLRETIETAAYVMRARAEEKNLGFSVEYAPDARGWFRGDAVRLKQIVANLASNAVKFTHEGEVKVTVDIAAGSAATAPAALRLEVSDTGIGFDAETAARLFQRFEQADQTITREFGGSGLGLSIVKGLVELMGGRIEVTSRPGGGSRFQVELPLVPMGADGSQSRTEPGKEAEEAGAIAHEPTLQMAPETRAEEPGEHAGSPAPNIRILLAEDHPVNRKVVSLILASHPVELTEVVNGSDAVEAFHAGGRTGQFDLILMDMQMPVMDGLTATARIRALEKEQQRAPVPIIMLTANAMPEHRAEARAAGADHYIAKPVTAEGLIAGIAAALNPPDMARSSAA